MWGRGGEHWGLDYLPSCPGRHVALPQPRSLPAHHRGLTPEGFQTPRPRAGGREDPSGPQGWRQGGGGDRGSGERRRGWRGLPAVSLGEGGPGRVHGTGPGAGGHETGAVGHGAGPGPRGGRGRRRGPAGRAAAEPRARHPHGDGGGWPQTHLHGQCGLRGLGPGAEGLFQPLRGDTPGGHPVQQALPTPQGLCLHRVCHQELGPSRRGAEQERLLRPGHQGAAQKKQLTRDQLHGPRGPSGTPRRQGGTLRPQQPPG